VSGGAEIYTHEVAKGMAARGAGVTVFANRFKGSPAEETIDGVRHMRRGNEFTVHFHGFLHALRNRRRYDLIIDQFNGMGFFCFLLPARSMLLIHQMYRGFWLRELGALGYVPYFVEPLLLRLYRKLPSVTVSDSTREDLVRMGFRNVRIVMNALQNEPLGEVPVKEDAPTLMYLGRLRSTKRPEDAIGIFREVRKSIPGARLWMVGSGPDEERLRRETAGVEGITFHGWVPSERKFELLRKAHVLVVPGVREGFGINVIEAASQGTPAVGYNIHGLRDSIRDGRTGLLASGVEDAARKVVGLLSNHERYRSMAVECLRYAREFNWTERAEEFWRAASEIAARDRR